MSDTTVYLKNYQAPAFTTDTVDLTIDLYDDYALVHSHLTLKRQGEGELRLYGEELELVSIQMNGVALDSKDYKIQDEDLIIKQCPDQFNLDIVTRIFPQKNTQLSGLYRSNHLFCTQCEAEGFRRITYYLDRPDVLATYTTRISADKAQYPTLLSNGNLIDSGTTPDGRHWVKWQDPFKKPSYLFAMVAGHLACVKDTFITCTGKSVDLHIYVEPGNEDKCGHAMASLKNSMRWDEEAFGREYDLDIYMIVAVSDFNMGAMENKGLNIFNSKYILARPDTATDVDYANIENVVAHEYFHNWTGNRITCRDWFQLSLKEGLTVYRDQEFSRDMNSRDVNRISDVADLRESQFPEDAGSMAHPVRPESYQEINNFYTATIYNKGAEVIRMQEALLGKAGFRKGMDLYFARHDGQAVTIDDFVKSMEDANHVDLTQFKRWYSQAGTPEVRAKTEFNNGTLTLTLQQHCPKTPDNLEKKPFHIPIRMALFDKEGKKLNGQPDLIELKEQEQTFTFNGLTSKPVMSLFRGFSAPIKLFNGHDSSELLLLLQHETDGFAKWEAVQQLVLNDINRCIQNPDQQWAISDSLSSALSHVLLDDALDMDLRAELISPPSFEDVAASLNEVEVGIVEKARDYFKQQLGLHIYDKAKAVYQQLWQAEDHQMTADAFGRRALRNGCLELMMAGHEHDSLSICQQQFSQAKTMTDQIASFALLVQSTAVQIRQEAIEQFYKQWAKEELVVNKWFAIQASCDISGTLSKVKELLKHPDFNIKNPNRVRSVIGAFCMMNPRNFHVSDGSGYQFLREMLVEIDKLNPQNASRLAAPFTTWQRYDRRRQELMRNELEKLASLKLSRDLQEIVKKSLVDV